MRLSTRILPRSGDEYARNLLSREHSNFRTNRVLRRAQDGRVRREREREREGNSAKREEFALGKK